MASHSAAAVAAAGGGKPEMLRPEQYVSAEAAHELLQEKFFQRFRSVREAFVRLDAKHRHGYVEPADLREQLTQMGIHMTTHEFKKLWRMYDTLNDGRLTYLEVEKKVGNLIKPTTLGLQATMRRPETPIMSEAVRKTIAMRLKRKLPSISSLWDELDEVSSGRISHGEFIAALRQLGVRHLGDKESFQLMQRYRKPDNFTGLMTREEFEECISDLCKAGSRGESRDPALAAAALRQVEDALAAVLPRDSRPAVVRALEPFDADRVGDLTHAQLKTALASLGVPADVLQGEPWAQFAAKYDPLGEGSVTIADFAAAWAKSGEVASNPYATITSPRMGGYAGYGPWLRLGLRPQSDPLSGKPLVPNKMARAAAPKLGVSESETLVVAYLVGRGQELRAAFERADPDRSGEVSKLAFREVMEGLDVDVTDEQIASFAYRYDKYKSGKIHYPDFFSAFARFFTAPPLDAAIATLMMERIPAGGSTARSGGGYTARESARESARAGGEAGGLSSFTVAPRSGTPGHGSAAAGGGFTVPASPAARPSAGTPSRALPPVSPMTTPRHAGAAAGGGGAEEDSSLAESVARRVKQVLGRSWTTVAADTTRRAEARQHAAAVAAVGEMAAGGTRGRRGAQPPTPGATLGLSSPSLRSAGMSALGGSFHTAVGGGGAALSFMGAIGGAGGGPSTSLPSGNTARGVVPVPLLAESLAAHGLELTEREKRAVAARYAGRSGGEAGVDLDRLTLDLSRM